MPSLPSTLQTNKKKSTTVLFLMDQYYSILRHWISEHKPNNISQKHKRKFRQNRINKKEQEEPILQPTPLDDSDHDSLSLCPQPSPFSHVYTPCLSSTNAFSHMSEAHQNQNIKNLLSFKYSVSGYGRQWEIRNCDSCGVGGMFQSPDEMITECFCKAQDRSSWFKHDSVCFQI